MTQPRADLSKAIERVNKLSQRAKSIVEASSGLNLPQLSQISDKLRRLSAVKDRIKTGIDQLIQSTADFDSLNPRLEALQNQLRQLSSVEVGNLDSTITDLEKLVGTGSTSGTGPDTGSGAGAAAAPPAPPGIDQPTHTRAPGPTQQGGYKYGASKPKSSSRPRPRMLSKHRQSTRRRDRIKSKRFKQSKSRSKQGMRSKRKITSKRSRR
jgi:hypothetical protein